jgi:predicted membrane-bound dolichyl-phosphate-mannose-protein mannosyltransferase
MAISLGARHAVPVPRAIWIFTIHFPLGRIADDVLAYAVQFIVVADDVFVIIALPYFRTGGIADFVDAFGGGGFE